MRCTIKTVKEAIIKNKEESKMKAQIKEWFENKLANELNLPRLYYLDIFCGIKESEKAVYAMFYTGYKADGRKANHRCHWIPKSAIENIEQLKIIPDYDEAVAAFNFEYDM
jgi:hypothetical protein